jgi:hypothetical protein
MIMHKQYKPGQPNTHTSSAGAVQVCRVSLPWRSTHPSQKQPRYPPLWESFHPLQVFAWCDDLN